MSFSRPIIVRHAGSLRHITPLQRQTRGFATTPLALLALRMSQPAVDTTTSTTISQLLPRFLQPLKSYLPALTFWRSGTAPKPKKKEWNPYTFFIAAFMIIGSQGINLIALKHDHKDFMRRADSRIDLLREVIERIERGEEVDVGKMLGAGIEAEEKSWEDVLKEIEEEDLMWQTKRAKTRGGAAEAAEKVEVEFAAAEVVEQKPKPVKKVDDSVFL